MKQGKSRKRRNSGGPQGLAETSREDDGGGEKTTQNQADPQKQDVLFTQEDRQADFYKSYRKVAEEYDKEFLKKHDEDLNTTLIFAGLFSAVASAFITQIDSQLQPDPNDETAALLRVIVYKMDNTTFGNHVPTLPQWTGPPSAIVHVQAILFASLTASLFSAFLAMLGKQWLNYYDSTYIRGTAIERSQNRQRKLDGFVAWYFENVMELLPLMLQAALLLFSCALSRYLWEVNMTIASVVLGVTSFGVLSYVFILVACTVFESCPYQTPGVQILRHLLPALRLTFSKLSRLIKTSCCYKLSITWREELQPWCSISNILAFPLLFLHLFIVLIMDACLIGKAMFRLVITLCRTIYHRLSAKFLRTHDSGQHTVVLDLRCVSWLLQTSLDKALHLTALNYLAEIPELTFLDPYLVVGCFNVLISCISVVDGIPGIPQGLEQLATLSANCFLRTSHNSFATNPTSTTLTDLRRSYTRVFSSGWMDFRDLRCRYTMVAAHILVNQDCKPPKRWKWWEDSRPSTQEQSHISGCIVAVAQAWYQQRQRGKVPRWTLRFALDSLSLDPPPPPSTVADCLKIIAIDLGCNVSNIQAPDESVQVISDLIARKLEMLVGSPIVHLFSKHKAISALLPHAISLEQSGDLGMSDTIFRLSRTLDIWRLWHYITPYMISLLIGPIPPSLNWATLLFSADVRWNFPDENAVARWAAAVSTVPYSEEVGCRVVDELLRLAHREDLRKPIPIHIWEWLKEQPPLSPARQWRLYGALPAAFSYIRGLGDLGIVKSYFLRVWSDLDVLPDSSFAEMQVSIMEDFGGIEMQHHRKDLVNRLDHILGEVDQELEYYSVHNRSWTTLADAQRKREQYRRLKEVLLEVDRKAIKHLAESHSTFTCALPLPCP